MEREPTAPFEDEAGLGQEVTATATIASASHDAASLLVFILCLPSDLETILCSDHLLAPEPSGSVTFLISSGQADVKRPLDGNTESRITRIKSHLSDLNREPRDYKSRALPVELRWRPAYSTRN